MGRIPDATRRGGFSHGTLSFAVSRTDMHPRGFIQSEGIWPLSERASNIQWRARDVFCVRDLFDVRGSINFKGLLSLTSLVCARFGIYIQSAWICIEYL